MKLVFLGSHSNLLLRISGQRPVPHSNSLSLGTLLYGVTPHDPATYAAVIMGMTLTAAAASYLAAYKAAALDPSNALRHE